MSPRLVRLFAVACGATVANLYYAQPLLDVIARAFDVSSGVAGLLVTASQIGYAVGLVLLVPLGDLVDRRRLVWRMLLVTAASLAVCAAAPSVYVLAVGVALAGVTTTVAQVLVPFASELADEEDRGRVVGTVMSGLLIGILMARTVSGLIADLAGWRAVYVVAAVVMVLLAGALARALPTVPGTTSLPYRRLVASVGTLVRREPVLRRRMAYGACGMATFSGLWTSLTFLLSREPYGYGEAAIGLFGLAGLVGAGSARFAGRLADAGRTRAATGAFWLAILASWGLLALGTTSVAAVVAGIVVLDFGVQGQHILNQFSIYEAVPDARSRVTTAYMGHNFLWGAAGAALSSAAFGAAGWGGVCGLGAAFSVAALAVWAREPAPTAAVVST